MLLPLVLVLLLLLLLHALHSNPIPFAKPSCTTQQLQHTLDER
jgi:hypothetical protein